MAIKERKKERKKKKKKTEDIPDLIEAAEKLDKKNHLIRVTSRLLKTLKGFTNGRTSNPHSIQLVEGKIMAHDTRKKRSYVDTS